MSHVSTILLTRTGRGSVQCRGFGQILKSQRFMDVFHAVVQCLNDVEVQTRTGGELGRVTTRSEPGSAFTSDVDRAGDPTRLARKVARKIRRADASSRERRAFDHRPPLG